MISSDADIIPYSERELREAKLTAPVLSRVLHYVDRGRRPSRREKAKEPVMVLRVPHLPIDLMFKNILKDPEISSYDSYVISLTKDLKDAMFIAQHHADKEQRRQEQNYNRRVKGSQITVVLQVKVDCKPAGQTVVKQTCSATCWPEGNCYYSWYRYTGSWNKKMIGCSYGATVYFISTSSSDQDRYYCKVWNGATPQHKCKLLEQQWGVTYTAGRVCALKGSSVDLSCSYKHPEGLTVTESLWYIESQWKFGAEPEDVRESDQYEGRVQYSRTLNSCRMTITDLRESDAHTYSFRFYTDDHKGRYSGRPGVTLSVTGNSGE
ncbi:hypothetical protein SRHO_G00103780 [Serrasalmus rhombeus]